MKKDPQIERLKPISENGGDPIRGPIYFKGVDDIPMWGIRGCLIAVLLSLPFWIAVFVAWKYLL
jgi:hypothetical protein